MAPITKQRATIEKQHYWLQLDLSVRAETLESALARVGKLFRSAYRKKLTYEGLVYMGAYSARCRGSLTAPRNSMHPTIEVKKGLPVKPGKTLQELDGDETAKLESRKKRQAREILAPPSQPHVVSAGQKPMGGAGPTKKSGLAGRFKK